MLKALCLWPSAPFTNSLVRKALGSLNIHVVSALPELSEKFSLLQWSSYDEIDHEFSMKDSTLQSSYIIRKSLIRKHFLSRYMSFDSYAEYKLTLVDVSFHT